MSDEITEIIRVLQLTTYDEDEWEADLLTVIKKAENAIGPKLQAANDWLQDPQVGRTTGNLYTAGKCPVSEKKNVSITETELNPMQ